MASTYQTNTAQGWKDMGNPFYMPTMDGITRCPDEAPFQCGYNFGNPVCVSDPRLCKRRGLPAEQGDGSTLVPVAHPTKTKTDGWCGGETNHLLPAYQMWNRSCRSVMPDLQNIIDGVYGDGLPFLQLASKTPQGTIFTPFKSLVTNQQL